MCPLSVSLPKYDFLIIIIIIYYIIRLMNSLYSKLFSQNNRNNEVSRAVTKISLMHQTALCLTYTTYLSEARDQRTSNAKFSLFYGSFYEKSPGRNLPACQMSSGYNRLAIKLI